VVDHAHGPSYSEGRGRRIIDPKLAGKKLNLYLKNKLQQKGLGGVAQVVECEHVNLGSNPRTTEQTKHHQQQEVRMSQNISSDFSLSF
jgi:hypothetical protein